MKGTAIFAAIALAGATAGCETFAPSICDRTEAGNPFIRYTQGTTEGGVYMSSPWDGELLYFPGGMHYQLEHDLEVTPYPINSYLSFDRYGTTDGGSLAPASGNQVILLGADAASPEADGGLNPGYIKVANDSCVDYWLLVVAGSGAAP